MHTLAKTNRPGMGRTELQELEDRLVQGDLMIRQREAAGMATDRLVLHWIELLRQYEDAYNSWQSAA